MIVYYFKLYILVIMEDNVVLDLNGMIYKKYVYVSVFFKINFVWVIYDDWILLINWYNIIIFIKMLNFMVSVWKRICWNKL